MSAEQDDPRQAFDDEAVCAEMARGYPHWQCTRPERHDGDHVAFGSEDQHIARWAP